jgi:hypothetical protein
MSEQPESEAETTADPAVGGESSPTNGTRRDIDGKPSIYYDGYWLRRYDISDTLAERRRLIESLTRRVFHHTEAGINTPGNKLEEARAAYEREADPGRKRVAAAMLAGALLNRASDVFTKLVELQNEGIEIPPGNELLRLCGRCYMEALELGKQVKHYSGEEGLDELWGEPMKAFSLPLSQFLEGRYIKVAQTMAAIDRITAAVLKTFEGQVAFAGLADKARRFAVAAKLESETLRTDPVIFEVWPEFVAAGEELAGFEARRDAACNLHELDLIDAGTALIRHGKDLMTWLASARIPMPKTTRTYVQACADFRTRLHGESGSAPAQQRGGT